MPAAETLDHKLLEKTDGYDAFDRIIRPFAVETGYDQWANGVYEIMANVGASMDAHVELGSLAGEETDHAIKDGQKVIKTASELGYFSRKIHPRLVVDMSSGHETANLILGAEYVDFHESMWNQQKSLVLTNNRIGGDLMRGGYTAVMMADFDKSGKIADNIHAAEKLELYKINELRMQGIRELRLFLPRIASQSYIWGRTGTLHFLNPDVTKSSTLWHHNGLSTTDKDLEDLQVEQRLKDFEESVALPKFGLLQLIGMHVHDYQRARQYGMQKEGFDSRWSAERTQVELLRGEEKARIIDSLRAKSAA